MMIVRELDVAVMDTLKKETLSDKGHHVNAGRMAMIGRLGGD
jgi:hypothetical protein